MRIYSKLIDNFKKAMMQVFKMKYLSLIHYFLSMEVYESAGHIFIYQTKYANDMLNFFGMDNYKPFPTPITHGDVLSNDDGPMLIDLM